MAEESNLKHGCNILGNSDTESGECCREHDRAYAKGEFIAKFVADFTLLFCMISTFQKGDNIVTTSLYFILRLLIAILMFAVTFTFGWIWWLKYLLRRLSGGKWFPKAKDGENP